jgi:glycosyltransferase involved in cell wall biosynthesis
MVPLRYEEDGKPRMDKEKHSEHSLEALSRSALSRARVAVVHELLGTSSDAERVLKEILALYPLADLFVLADFVSADQRGFLGQRRVETSFIQNLPFARQRFRWYLPLMPFTIEQFDLSKYDLIISNSSGLAKGVISRVRQLHISYVHGSIGYAGELPRDDPDGRRLSWPRSHALRNYLRRWDLQTANGVDFFVANSSFAAQRILQTYSRRAEVIYPPVDVEKFVPDEKRQDFYVALSPRFLPGGGLDMVLDAFAQMPRRRLVILGESLDLKKLKARVPANVELRSCLSNEQMTNDLGRAKAIVIADQIDFSVVAVEAQASGTPMIAFKGGAAVEIVEPGNNGVLFRKRTAETLVAAIERFERTAPFRPSTVAQTASRFSAERFRREFQALVTRTMETAERHQLWSGTQSPRRVRSDLPRATA